MAKERFKSFLKLFEFCCSSYRDRDNADNMMPCHIIRNFWKILTLVTCGDHNDDLSEKNTEVISCVFFRELSNVLSVYLFVTQELS